MKNDLPGIFRGAVDIEISGRFSERFLNLAFQEGIELSHIHNKETSVLARVPLAHQAAARRHNPPPIEQWPVAADGQVHLDEEGLVERRRIGLIVFAFDG